MIERIYDQYDPPSIIKYVELSTTNLFTIYFFDYHFDK